MDSRNCFVRSRDGFIVGFRICIITYNSEFAFIHVKCDVARNPIQRTLMHTEDASMLFERVSSLLSKEEHPSRIQTSEPKG